MKHFAAARLGASVLALAAVAAGAPAMAQVTVPAMTPANTQISNTATVSFQVAGVPQTGPSASTDFRVDRMISMTLDEPGGVTTPVAPGAQGQVTTFLLQNLSNATLDFALAAANEADGTTKHTGTTPGDTFDVTNIRMFMESGTTPGYDPSDTLVTHIDNLPSGAFRTIYVVADIPAASATVANGRVAEVRLTATAREPDAMGTLGGVITTSATNTNAMESFFAEPAGQDTANDGVVINYDDYTVGTAVLNVIKQSRVISDTVDVPGGPYALTGSVVEYCIRVQNAAGSAKADQVTVSDELATALTLVTGSIRINGTVSGTTCQADGVAGGSVSGRTISATIPEIAAGSERTVYFQATIN